MTPGARLIPMPRRAPKTTTRYRPLMMRDGRTELISAADRRAHDVEQLCERLPKDFITRMLLLDDDELEVLTVLAKGLFTSDDDRLDGAERVGRKRAAGPRGKPGA